jgi:sulfhydrogenase subunit beta (sulfur reductase)
MFKKISREKIPRWLARLKSEAELFAPAEENGGWTFGGREDPDLPQNFRNSRLSAKGFFLEGLKPLFGWRSSDQGPLQVTPLPGQDRPRVIFGIRACDARAIRIIEPVFAENGTDGLYLGNLRRTLLVGQACEARCRGSFCQEMGIDPQDSKDCDLFFREAPSGKLARVNTEGGKARVEGRDFFLDSSPEEWESARKEVRGGPTSPLFDLEKVKDEVARRFPEEELWKQVSAPCINCGICTYLCPTCHCFDISDLQAAGRGVRFRSWDSCAFPGFTQMAVHNPREEKWRRYRQRVSHKFYFFPRNFQTVACVGCGRCVAHCPVHLDLREVLREVSR